MVAIIGMACQVPGADDVESFWRNLCAGVESRTEFTDEQLLAEGVPEETLRDPHYVKAGMVLPDIAGFDADFFGISPHEARLMDPQQRLLLECAWTALEHAGHAGHAGANIGVYAGIGWNRYFVDNVLPSLATLDPAEAYQAHIANGADFCATRIAYALDLRGPAIGVQTACSTSLVAVHLACRALQAGDCDVALAGGVSLAVPQATGYLYQQGMIRSPDGHCRAFDAAAQGTVRGSGVGLVVLRRLEDAKADGDTIHAVIRGSAINNDGRAKIGFTAPGVDGQEAAIARALAAAGVDPTNIGYLEAHGTGTPMGDPIEMAALAKAFGLVSRHARRCPIGSVKTNIGHLDTASGVAGLIKAALAVRDGLIPASLHFAHANSEIDFAGSPFDVNTTLRQWQVGSGEQRRAGVSSFGIGGTNAHLVLEEPPETEAGSPSLPCQLVPLSAQTATALEALRSRLEADLTARAADALADAAYTLAIGRKVMPQRSAIIIDKRLATENKNLASPDTRAVFTGVAPSASTTAIFMLPGQGSQYAGMAAGLYRDVPLFRDILDECANLLLPETGFDLREVVTASDQKLVRERINETHVTQPALFALEYALSRLLISWGVKPDAMIGHSLGEYVAACLAEVFSLSDALKIVSIRARLMQQMPKGRMLAVPLSEHDAAPYVDHDVAIAAVNGPRNCVLAGPTNAITCVYEKLLSAGIGARPLETSHAFHSPMMDEVLAPFAAELQKITLCPPKLKFISCVTGDWISPDSATSILYWVTHLRQPVRFGDGIRRMLEVQNPLLLEVGPGQVLSSLTKSQAGRRKFPIIQTMRRDGENAPDLNVLLKACAQYWVSGGSFDWRAFYCGQRRRRVALPTYPFEHQSHWINAQWRAEQPRQMVDKTRAAAAESDECISQTSALASALEERLGGILAKGLGISFIGRHDNFFDLGGNSLLALSLSRPLGTALGLSEADPHLLLHAPTVAALAACDNNSTRASPEHPAVVTLREGRDRRPPLFLVHPVGGHVFFYRALAAHLPPEQPVLAIQAGEMPQSVPEMATRYLAEIRRHQARGPFYLGGSSFGGMVAYEIARQLRDVFREEVPLLTMIDTPGPGHLPNYRMANSTDIMAYALELWAGNTDAATRLRSHPPDQRMAYFLQNATGLRANLLTEADVSRFCNIFSNNVRAMFDYNGAEFGGDILFFKARDIRPGFPSHPEMAWIPLVHGRIEIHEVPGDHISINEIPNVGIIAEILRAKMAKPACTSGAVMVASKG